MISGYIPITTGFILRKNDIPKLALAKIVSPLIITQLSQK